MKSCSNKNSNYCTWYPTDLIILCPKINSNSCLWICQLLLFAYNIQFFRIQSLLKNNKGFFNFVGVIIQKSFYEKILVVIIWSDDTVYVGYHNPFFYWFRRLGNSSVWRYLWSIPVIRPEHNPLPLEEYGINDTLVEDIPKTWAAFFLMIYPLDLLLSRIKELRNK